MSAADLLRVALDDASPALHVEKDAYDGRAVLIDDDGDVLLHQRDLQGDGAPVMRLIGLLLAAAPHLADLLEREDRRFVGELAARTRDFGARGPDFVAPPLTERIAAAIEEAAR